MTTTRWHYAPTPIGVPKALLDAFELLKAEAVLVGGSASTSLRWIPLNDQTTNGENVAGCQRATEHQFTYRWSVQCCMLLEWH